MNILYFTEGYSTHDHRFLSKMAGTRHQILLLMLKEIPGFRPKDKVPPGIRSLGSLGYRGSPDSPEHLLSCVPSFLEVLGAERPDLVHAGPVQSCGYLTALADHHPFLLMSWGYDILGGSRKDNSWFRVTEFTLRHSDWLLCDSESVRSSAQEIHPHPDDRILQLPWGVDLETFSPGKNSSPLRRTLGWDDCFVLLWTRMWEPVYGILTLLSAFAQARQRNPALRLILLGDGSLSEEVRDRISRHGIDGEIFLPGILPEDELADVFHASDAYVSCSQVDGSSVSLLQALACGLPVVVSDIPGNREWVTPGENGFLVPPGDVDGYMRALLTVSLVSRKKRSEMARLNREKAERKADWNRNIGVLFSAYERIAALTEGSTGKK